MPQNMKKYTKLKHEGIHMVKKLQKFIRKESTKNMKELNNIIKDQHLISLDAKNPEHMTTKKEPVKSKVSLSSRLENDRNSVEQETPTS